MEVLAKSKSSQPGLLTHAGPRTDDLNVASNSVSSFNMIDNGYMHTFSFGLEYY